MAIPVQGRAVLVTRPFGTRRFPPCRNGETRRRAAFPIGLPHAQISVLNIPGKAFGIEQRTSVAAAHELVLHRGKVRTLARELESWSRDGEHVITWRGKPLVMRAFAFGDTLASGVWGIREPKPDAPEVFPEVLLVPLLAFDRRGNRIGYGGGYYDLTITALRARQPILAAGIAFAEQEQKKVPAGPRDARLDLVLTEREVIHCGRA